MTYRTCPEPGCPTLIPPTARRCPTHTRARDHARGTAAKRGYDHTHRQVRTHWRQLIAAAAATNGQPILCARCGRPIRAGDAFDLDHADDRRTYLGPSHASCNRAAGGRAAHTH